MKTEEEIINEEHLLEDLNKGYVQLIEQGEIQFGGPRTSQATDYVNQCKLLRMLRDHFNSNYRWAHIKDKDNWFLDVRGRVFDMSNQEVIEILNTPYHSKLKQIIDGNTTESLTGGEDEEE